jgi:hypothetical protein
MGSGQLAKQLKASEMHTFGLDSLHPRGERGEKRGGGDREVSLVMACQSGHTAQEPFQARCMETGELVVRMVPRPPSPISTGDPHGRECVRGGAWMQW